MDAGLNVQIEIAKNVRYYKNLYLEAKRSMKYGIAMIPCPKTTYERSLIAYKWAMKRGCFSSYAEVKRLLAENGL